MTISAESARRLDRPEVRCGIDAVRAAMRTCQRVRQRQTEVAQLLKDDRSPVTVADFASQAIVLHRLSGALGAIAVVAEEDADVLAGDAGAAGSRGRNDEMLATVVSVLQEDWPDVTGPDVLAALATGRRPSAGEPFWTLDPVDGTKGFLRNQQYAIALALIEDGRPRLGILGCPNLSSDPDADPDSKPSGVLSVAIEGHGAFEASAADAYVRLPRTSRDVGSAPRICLSLETGHSDSGRITGILDRLGRAVEAVHLDSQCKYAAVARGQADAYVRAGRGASYAEWIWDHAAGAILAAEAGCIVTDLSGKPLDFGAGPRLTQNTGIICARPALHASLVEAAAS